ncbi:uncharacterized protein LOC131929595 [Physella acuta]|uniref:uncharacterized protein LOC131929595 n=1 Tax=Physella acuta TaxID=109671 RepID=UPI0027DD828E|nr:uncharacterized protein LOC131929595 [Physella acuta]
MIIGYSTNYIGKWGSFVHAGLWDVCLIDKMCYELELFHYTENEVTWKGWFSTCRKLLAVCLSVEVVVLLITLSALLKKGTITSAWCTSIVVFLSVILGLVGIGVAAVQINKLLTTPLSGISASFGYTVGWSFDLIISGLLLFTLSGVLNIVDAKRSARQIT